MPTPSALPGREEPASSASPNSAPDDPIDPATARRIRAKSRQIVRRAGLSRSDREDVAQALAARLLAPLRAFDPAKLPREAYVRMVLRRATASVLGYLRAAKRAGPAVVSLEAFLRQDADDPLEPADRPGRRSAEEAADLARDVADLLAALPPDLRELAEQLKERSMAGAARDRDVSRITVYARLAELRSRFARAGLNDYL